MGNSSSVANYNARIETKDGKKFSIPYHSLVEHILLLRKVINDPDMRKEGPMLDYFIKDYCKRMAQGEMKTTEQQLKLPWQTEWIWHVHRLHPLAYINDCNKQLLDRLIDKKTQEFIRKYGKEKKPKLTFTSINTDSSFVPSVDLASAVIQQKDFLDKFQKHRLYSHNLNKCDRSNFQNLVQDYASFIKLGSKKQMIVPTFDIDLIWHTHMRYPSHYHEFSIALCGFILDHDDSIETYILTDAYQMTANRWKQTYQSEYGKSIDRDHLKTSQYQSSCAVVFVPSLVLSASSGGAACASGGSTCGASNCGGGDSGGGGECGGGDGGGGGGCGSSCGGGCGGGCGGD